MKNHPLDDLTSSDFIYQVLRTVVVVFATILITYQVTPLIMELIHEAYRGIHYWLFIVMDHTRTFA